MCSVHTAVEFEKRGVPATVVIVSGFKRALDVQFEGKGMRGHPCLELPHLAVITRLSRDELSSVVSGYAGEVVQQLTGGTQS